MGVDESACVERAPELRRRRGAVGQRHALVGQAIRLDPVARPAGDLREPDERSLHAGHVAFRPRALETDLVDRPRLGEPIVQERPHAKHRARVVPVDRPLLQLATAPIRGFVVAVAVQEPEVGAEEERPRVRPGVFLRVEQRDRRVGVLDRALDVAVVPEPRGGGVRARGEPVVAGVLERVEDEAVARVALALVPEAVAEVAQQLRAQVAVHRGGVERFQRRTRSGRLACIEEVVGEQERPTSPGLVRSLGSGLKREPRQLACGRRGTACGRVGRSGVELGGDGLVGPLGGEREMPRSRLEVARKIDQLPVHVTSPAGGGGLVERGGQQRVLEVDAAGGVDADDARLLGWFECVGRGHGSRRRRQRRRQQERVTRLARQASDVQTHELLRARGNRQLAGRVVPASDELACDLERVEGIAARAFDDPHDRRAWQRATDACADHLVHRRDGERPQLEVGPPIFGQRGLERVRPPGVRPDRAEDADPRVGATPERERERVHRRRVEPLRVVDRDEDRLDASELVQGRRGPRRQRAAIDPAVGRVLPQERCRQRAPLRRRQAVKRCVVDVREQVDEPANESDASTPAGRATSTRQPRSAARSTPACQTVVFPIPAGPRTASAAAPSAARVRNASIAPSSRRRPITTGWSNPTTNTVRGRSSRRKRSCTIGRPLTTAPTPITEFRRPRFGRTNGLVRFVARRLLAFVFLLVGITAVVFLLTQLVPSNAVATNLGEQAAGDPAAVAAFKHHYGLDKPLPER